MCLKANVFKKLSALIPPTRWKSHKDFQPTGMESRSLLNGSGFGSLILVHRLLRNFTLWESYSWVKKTVYDFYRQKINIPSLPKKSPMAPWAMDHCVLVAFAIGNAGSQQGQAGAAMGPCCHHAGSGTHHTCKTTFSLSLSPPPSNPPAPLLCQFPNYLKYLVFNLTRKNLGLVFWRDYGKVNSVKQKQQTHIPQFQFMVFLEPTESNVCC